MSTYTFSAFFFFFLFLFFFNDTATTEIYTLSLHDALPIYETTGEWGSDNVGMMKMLAGMPHMMRKPMMKGRINQLLSLTEEQRQDSIRDMIGAFHSDKVKPEADRKSTRLNSSHKPISYAVFCLKKKNKKKNKHMTKLNKTLDNASPYSP